MDFIEIRNDENFKTCVDQMRIGYIIGDIGPWIATELEDGLYHEVMEDDAANGGKTVEEILHEQGLSVRYFIEIYLPAEFELIRPTDLGKVKFIAKHGDCPECGFDMEADGRNMKCTNNDCEHEMSAEKFYDI